MTDTEKKSYSAAWKRELPCKYLDNEEDVWNDDDFLPNGVSINHRDHFRRIYKGYFRQICDTDGFDIDIYPGDAKAAIYIPYLDFENEADMLLELANHAIQDYNNRETTVYKYKVACIEKVNYILEERREFFMTVVAQNLTLPEASETFQIHAYKGSNEENVVCLCRKKSLK